jgi:hypothetical protein
MVVSIVVQRQRQDGRGEDDRRALRWGLDPHVSKDAHFAENLPRRRRMRFVIARRPDMSRLIRMDETGHTTLAEWTAGDAASVQDAVAALHAELDQGYFAVVSTGEGHAEQVRELPLDAPLVILRRPIAGG